MSVVLSALAQTNLRSEVAKNLQSAQNEMNAKNYVNALNHAKSAQAIADLNTQEHVLIEKTILAAAINAKDHDAAIEASKYLAHESTLSNSEQLAYLEILINILSGKGEAELLSKYAKEYFGKGGEKESVRKLYVQSLSMQKMHVDVIQYLVGLEQTKNIKIFSEAELQALAIAYKATKNDKGYFQTLKKLVTVSSNKDYWLSYVDQVKKQKYYNARYELDLLRLMLARKLIEDPIDYIYYAQTALQFGLPYEAKSVIDAGRKVNAFSTNSVLTKVKVLTNEVDKKINSDEKQILALEKSNNEKDFAELSEVYFSRGDYKQAIEKYKFVLAAKPMRREAELRLHYLVSLIKEGDYDRASEVLMLLEPESTANEVGFLWTIK